MEHKTLSIVERKIIYLLNENKLFKRVPTENNAIVIEKFTCKICKNNNICKCYIELMKNTPGICKCCDRLEYLGEDENIRKFLGYDILSGVLPINLHGESPIEYSCCFCTKLDINCLCYEYITDDKCSYCSRAILCENAFFEEDEIILNHFGYIINDKFDKVILDIKNETNYKCIICCTNQINAALLTCRHAMFCRDCLLKIRNLQCPYCREKFMLKDVFKIYLP